MKIVNLEEFLSLPVGTVYMKYEPCVFEDLCVKGESLDGDFIFSGITFDIDCTGSDDFVDKLFDAEENKTSLKTDFDSTSRDCLFNAGQLFAVYEKEDVERLIAKLNDSLKVYIKTP